MARDTITLNCLHCGKVIGADSAFCRFCGTSVPPPTLEQDTSLSPPPILGPQSQFDDFAKSSRVFISYRRSSSKAMAVRLEQKLKQDWPDMNVFRDESDASGGTDWKQHIQQRIDEAHAMLVIIDRDWAGERLLDSSDVLRREVSYAFSNWKVVVPVLLEDAQMPPSDQLPQELKQVASLQACRLTESNFDHDFAELQNDLLARLKEWAEYNDAETRMLEEGEKILREGGEVDIDALFGAELEKQQKFIPEKALPGLGVRNFVLDGQWRITAYPPQGRLQLTVEIAYNEPFRGKWEFPDAMGRPAEVAVSGNWLPVFDDKLLLGIHFDGTTEIAEPFNIRIPMHELVGYDLRGNDSNGVGWISTNVKPREGGF